MFLGIEGGLLFIRLFLFLIASKAHFVSRLQLVIQLQSNEVINLLLPPRLRAVRGILWPLQPVLFILLLRHILFWEQFLALLLLMSRALLLARECFLIFVAQVIELNLVGLYLHFVFPVDEGLQLRHQLLLV